jgi:hypothetical protein
MRLVSGIRIDLLEPLMNCSRRAADLRLFPRRTHRSQHLAVVCTVA